MLHFTRPGKNSTSNGRLRYITGLPAYSSLTPLLSAIDNINTAFIDNQLVTIELLNEYAITDVINHIENDIDHIRLSVFNQSVTIGFCYKESELWCLVKYNDDVTRFCYDLYDAINILNDIINELISEHTPKTLFAKLKHALRG